MRSIGLGTEGEGIGGEGRYVGLKRRGLELEMVLTPYKRVERRKIMEWEDTGNRKKIEE